MFRVENYTEWHDVSVTALTICVSVGDCSIGGENYLLRED